MWSVADGAYLNDLLPLRYDEATTYNNFVSKPLYVALANYATPNNHLLHTFLAKVSVGLAGNEPWAIRLPALLAGIADAMPLTRGAKGLMALDSAISVGAVLLIAARAVNVLGQ